MMTVHKAATELTIVLKATMDGIVQFGIPDDQSEDSNLFKCAAMLIADSMSNSTTLSENYEKLPDDETRYVLIYQCGVRLKAAAFLGEHASMLDRELSKISPHSLIYPYLVLARCAFRRLEEAWKFYNTHVSTDTIANDSRFSSLPSATFERAQKEINAGELRVPKFDGLS